MYIYIFIYRYIYIYVYVYVYIYIRFFTQLRIGRAAGDMMLYLYMMLYFG